MQSDTGIDRKRLEPLAHQLGVENPDLLLPVREVSRRLIDKIRSNASDQSAALVAFMALEGLRCLPLLDIDVLTQEERQLVIEKLHDIVKCNELARP